MNLILSALDAAEMANELNLPGLAFHSLKGNRKGEFSVSVSGNWRITFGWARRDAINIDLEDYHGK